MKFTPNLLDDIRSRVSITSVVGKRVQWDRRKSNPSKGDMWACCPFHTEKSPSFHVEERKGRYHCFGCKNSGDIFTFLVENQGLSFPEAVELLANEAGIKIAQQTPQEIEREKKRLNLYDVMELASHFYQSQLHSNLGSHALKYIKSRGVNEFSIGEFGLGYAPSNRVALKEYLRSQGVSEEEMTEAGLIVSGEDISNSYDRFRDRVIFPIHDARGRTIAFGGRAMASDATAKYLNSPETPIFSKGQILFNFHRARSPAFEQNQIIVVEGYLDVILLSQSGIRNSVAPLGTAVTENQLTILWKASPDVVLCFDGDSAGYSAASRTFDRAMPFFDGTHSLSMAFMIGGKDPADMAAAGQVQAFKTIIKNAVTSNDYFWNRSTASTKIDSPEQKAMLESNMLEQISKIQDQNVQKHYRYQTRLRLADLFFKHDRTILRQVDRKRNTIPVLGESVAETQIEIELTLLGLVVQFPEFFAESHQFFELRLLGPRHAEFKSELIRILVREGQRSIAAIYQSIHPDFIEVLENAHGRAVFGGSNSSKSRLVKAQGHNLFRRCPIAKRKLPEPFAFNVFEVYLLLHLKTLLKDDLRFVEQELVTEFNEKNFSRIDAILGEIETVSSKILNLERQMLEESAEISANGRAETAEKAA